jgi:uncharacterized protein (DUF1697 family)
MTTWVALLRGINVGGRHLVPMPELRALIEGLGYANVATYINSGNVLFEVERPAADLGPELAAGLADALEDRFGFAVPVVVRTAAEIVSLPLAHPLAGHAEEKLLHVAFLDAAPSSEAVAAFPGERYAPDLLTVEGREAYLAYPGGSGRSKLNLDVIERALGVTATGRNWLTVNKLRELCAER